MPTSTTCSQILNHFKSGSVLPLSILSARYCQTPQKCLRESVISCFRRFTVIICTKYLTFFSPAGFPLLRNGKNFVNSHDRKTKWIYRTKEKQIFDTQLDNSEIFNLLLQIVSKIGLSDCWRSTVSEIFSIMAMRKAAGAGQTQDFHWNIYFAFVGNLPENINYSRLLTLISNNCRLLYQQRLEAALVLT